MTIEFNQIRINVENTEIQGNVWRYLMGEKKKKVPGYRTKNNNKPWKKEEDEFLKEAYNNGLTVGEIADTIQRSNSAISTRMWQLSHNMVKKPEEIKEVSKPKEEFTLA